MMLRTLLLFPLLLLSCSLLAQEPFEWLSCGSPSHKSAWLKDYQANPSQYAPLLQAKSNSIQYVGLTIHQVFRDDSTGSIPIDHIFQSVCQLNTDFSATGIQFYVEPPISKIYDSDFYAHDSVAQGGQKMLQYNRDSSLNVYFVASAAAGNCGYNLPYAGVAMSNSCLTGHTFAHELGHALGLPHTFIGWEGGQSWNASPQTSFSQPAPTTVTINYTDFKDQPYPDTLIIDTLLVEKVPRTGPNANCGIAADGFCDTPADYLAYRWACNAANGASTVTQLDPDSVAFLSDGWYIMSYALSSCQVGFSQEQIQAMNAFLLTERGHWIGQPLNTDSITAMSTLISPAQNAIIPAEYPVFRWTAVEGATAYLFQLYREPMGGGQLLEELLVTDTFFQTNRILTPRIDIFPYSWRVKPLHYNYFCAGYGPSQQFNTNAPTAVISTEVSDLNSWQMAPNPLPKGQPLQISWTLADEKIGQWRIFNAQGQLIWEQVAQLQAGSGRYQLQLPTDWASGSYFLQFRSKTGEMQGKLFIIK
ncbi:zinc-dependent metalloprotease [Saprospira sp. CCB-QB6]|uniref:zinc-dependent metalloprotease n=1 Tax=Saprospira sp. CCB-QB6 TaxID=3023936 RepID=UPI00234A67F1|nr:zinc-dependent metalloprotease [Saprospira sp. CCB-QB6]WCL80640.1 zinc-dependent metalloprotease [Saprospira sp. CCB-QB6]